MNSVRDNILQKVDQNSSAVLFSKVQHRVRRWGKRGRIVLS